MDPKRVSLILSRKGKGLSLLAVAEGKERRWVTLPTEYWTYLEKKAEETKGRQWWGRHNCSTELLRLVKSDMDLKKAGFLDK